ncbi:hypothetical protein MPC1_1880002 [Methylocella tundrae]|nr:hypothetical protein MPC1_1880002 [Methylocella tundrae]
MPPVSFKLSPVDRLVPAPPDARFVETAPKHDAEKLKVFRAGVMRYNKGLKCGARFFVNAFRSGFYAFMKK